MPDTYTLLEKVTVGAAGASSITFTNIPQTYTDLVVKISARTDNSISSWLVVAPNGSTSNLTNIRFEGYGPSGTGSGTLSTGFQGYLPAADYTANTFGTMDIYIPNYTSANQKSMSTDNAPENNSSSEWYVNMTALRWANTSAITSLAFNSQAGNLVQHSTFYLYGVAKLGVTPTSAPKATGGDIIVSDGTYWYHAFLSSSTFTPKTSLSCDVLVVAGGGGATNGNAEASGGGGAGGLCNQTGRSAINGTSYTVTVGAGGTGASIASGSPTQGNNSVFDTITANGGGASRSESLSPTSLRNGGSGGGGGGNSTSAGTATQGTSGGATGYGNNGGTGYNSNPYTGGGGGGAGAAGANAGSGGGGNGGAGLNTWSTWASATGTGVSGYYAGGGGGGNYSSGGVGTATTGGAGGGGNGGKTTSTTVNNQPTAGTANTGGGAGGGQGSSEFKNGGSGIVIVRYAV